MKRVVLLFALGLSAACGSSPPPASTADDKAQADSPADTTTPGKNDPPDMGMPPDPSPVGPPLTSDEATEVLTKMLALAEELIGEVEKADGCDAKADVITAFNKANESDVAMIRDKAPRIEDSDRAAFTNKHQERTDGVQKRFEAVEKECGDNEKFEQAIKNRGM